MQWIMTGLLAPVIGGAFWVLQKRMDRLEQFNEDKRKEIWDAVDADRKGAHAWQLEATRSFASNAALQTLKEDMDKRFDRLEMLIRNRGSSGS